MHTKTFFPFLLPLSLCFAFLQTASASVLAIDYGADWIKASLMKPGLTFDVLLNKDSKRKIQSSVGWKRDDRLFGTDAYNLAARFPSDSFSSLKFLQGAPSDSLPVSYFKSISTAEVIETTRQTVGLRRPDGTEWSVEELIAMQLSYVKDLAQAVAGERVRDAIVTVPPYYTETERNAVADAIEIAGLRTMALINDGSAVAVNYAMTRTFANKPEYHVIYDAGASSIRATVVAFSTAPSEVKGKDSTVISVAGIGYDRSTGGTELDRRLRELLISDFESKHGKSLRGDKRAMAKLWKEAGRVKAILSANSESTTTVESLAYDIDFKSKVSRSAFEEACSDLKSRFAEPITDALANAGLKLNDITSVVMTGGSSRTPMIQAAVKAAVGEDKLAWNVNADEAAVLGAALYGAGLSRQFRTKDIRISDVTPYDIQVSYAAEAKADSTEPRIIHTLVFPAGSKTGTKKTLTFKRKSDFTLTVGYKNAPAPGFPTDLLEHQITGVEEAIRNLTEWGVPDPVVKATAQLSESGFISLHGAVAYGEIKDSLAGKLKGFFGAGSSSSSSSSSEQATEAADNATASSSSEAAAETKGAVKGPNTIDLKVTVGWSSIAPMSTAEKRKARDRLAAISAAEKAVEMKEEALNALEAYLYRVRDLLSDTSETAPFVKCSKDSERQAIAKKLDETMAWLSEKGDEAGTTELIEKRTSIEALERPIGHRYREIEEFPKALNQSQMWNWSTRLFLTEARQNLTEEAKGGPPARYDKDELEALEATLKEHEVWMNEWVEKQKSVKMNEDPVLESEELRRRVKPLEEQLHRLVKRKVPLKKTNPFSGWDSSTTSGSASPSASDQAAGDSATTSPTGSPTPSPSEKSHDEL